MLSDCQHSSTESMIRYPNFPMQLLVHLDESCMGTCTSLRSSSQIQSFPKKYRITKDSCTICTDSIRNVEFNVNRGFWCSRSAFYSRRLHVGDLETNHYLSFLPSFPSSTAAGAPSFSSGRRRPPLRWDWRQRAPCRSGERTRRAPRGSFGPTAALESS
jgi:hypothetical protein